MPDLDERLGTLDRVSPPDLWSKIERHQPRRPLVPDHDRRGPSRMLAAVVAILVAAAGITVAVRAFSNGRPAPPVHPSPGPSVKGSLILFETQSKTDPTPVIAVMNAEGTGIRRLVHGMDPTWSPDGTKIAFSCGSPSSICVMDATGGDVRKITDPRAANGEDQNPSWGPEKIAFTRVYPGARASYPRAIFIVSPDGHGLRRLTTGDDFDPTWSPDGGSLAYVSVRTGKPPGQTPTAEFVEQIWVRSVDGLRDAQLTHESAGAWRPAWSPDGSLIAFDEDTSIFVMSPDGTGIRKLEPGTTGETPGGLGSDPTWSPDSEQIAFTCGNPDTNHDICVMNADGTGRRNLTTGPESETTPAWQPSGEPLPAEPSPSHTPTPTVSLPSAGEVVGTLPLAPDNNSLFTVVDGTVEVATWPYNDDPDAFTLITVGADGSRTEATVAFDRELLQYVASIAASPEGVYLGTSVIQRFTDASDQLVRIDPITGEIAARASFPGRVDPLAADGKLWASLGDGRIVRLDPMTLDVVAFRRLAPSGRSLSNSAMLSPLAFGRDRVWVLAQDGTDLEVVGMDPITLEELSRAPVSREGELAQALTAVIADESSVYIAGSAIQSVAADGIPSDSPVLLFPDSVAAALWGDLLVGFTQSSDSPVLLLLDAGGHPVAGLPLVSGVDDPVVEEDDLWFGGDAGQGSGVVHVRLAVANTEPTSPGPSIDVPPQQGLPEAVANTRARVFTAAELGDYELLRDVLDPTVFLSDYGFGVDPIDDWEAVGLEPLQVMAALLQMPFVVKESNEGTLYQWPRFGPDTAPGDLTPEERAILASVFTDEEIDAMFRSPDDGGYVGPQLGILADGTWFIFRTPAEGRP